MVEFDGARVDPHIGDSLDVPFDLNTELGRDLAAVKWDRTGVGAWRDWPAVLTSAVRLMIGSRFAMWMAWGPDLTFFCNDAYRRDTLGAKYPWALGKPAREVWSEIWQDIGPRIDSVLTTGVATWDEGLLLFLERSGYTEETYHTFSYSPLTGDDSRIAGMLCVVSEESARVIGERRMALLRDLGADLAAATTEVEVGSAAQRQLAADPHDLPFALAYLYDTTTGVARLQWASGITMGTPAAPLVVHPDDIGQVWHAALFASGGAQRIDDVLGLRGLPTGGWSEPPTQSLAVPLRQLGQRDPYGYLIVGLNRYRDLDDDHRGFVELVAGQISAAVARARAYEEQRERGEQLARLDRAKTTFFTNVSHELRTPLTLLLGPTEDALADRADVLSDTQRHRLEIVHRNGERLLKLVSTLLDFSRLESGRFAAVYEQLDLSRFTSELACMFESAFTRSGLRLTIDCDPLPEWPYVDREMWSKIVLNLLSNALKATFTGGVTVRLSPDSDRAGVRLEVIDTGVGIPVAEQDRLFERFHRVSGAALRTHEGSGIGLALVSELASLHGGEVSVRSAPGAGSTFTVRIPCGVAHLPAAQVAQRHREDDPEVTQYGAAYVAEAWRWIVPDGGSENPPDGRAPTGLPRILIVDDNADMRDYVQSLLRHDYSVQSAPNGAVALAQIRTSAPDLVLSDVMMPELDGFGLLAAIRNDPNIAHIPVVLLSARSGDDATVEGLEAGADDYLVKPFSARELLARVRANLELDRVRRLVTEMERGRELLDNAESLAHIGSWELDLRTDRIRASAELLRILGATEGYLATHGLADVLSTVDSQDRDRVRDAISQAIDHGVPLDVEVRASRLDDGEQYLCRVRAVAIPDDTGVAVFLRGSAQDVTVQRAAEVALSAAHAEREVAAREHAIASELQASLLPPRSFVATQLDIAAFYQAGVEGTQVGGDWHDVIDLGAGRTALVIGDVMGRGVRAAAVMGQLRAAVRAYARLDIEPEHLLRLLDDAVRDISTDTIVTCVYAVHDPSDQSLVYATAGHLPPLVTVPGQPTRRLSAGGPPLGVGRHGEVSESVALPIGATLTLYTDGLVERRGCDIDSGIDRLAELVRDDRTPLADLPAALVAALLPDGPDDDVALLVCRVTREPSDEHVAVQVVELGEGGVGTTRQFVSARLQEWGVSEAVSSDVRLAVSELTTNAIRHGQRPITVRIRLSNDVVVLEVHDCGTGIPRLRKAAPDDLNGRGLLLVSGLAARWGTRSTPTGKIVWGEFGLRRPSDSRTGPPGLRRHREADC